MSYLLCELVDPGLVFSPLPAVPCSRVIHNCEGFNLALRPTPPVGADESCCREETGHLLLFEKTLDDGMHSKPSILIDLLNLQLPALA